ncbi:hypothetical protein QBC43DRAFT_335690 [Cladorrhinum sp. PSN259]|nr:hypothetical protein QBC43DRAFT_335690 [Cladorrhinum sp. PSN259]
MEFICSRFPTGFYGRGIYSTRFSRYADCYSANEGQSRYSSLKVIIICQVAVGNIQRLTRFEFDRTGPDPGYHSTEGDEVGMTGEESAQTVVFRDDAIIPVGIAVYRGGV